MTLEKMEAQLGSPSGFICPECNGPLWEVHEGIHTQYRCLVGHQFSPESFLAEETEALERSLWVAVKTLEERATLLRRLSQRATEQGQTVIAENFADRAGESEEHAATIQRILKRLRP